MFDKGYRQQQTSEVFVIARRYCDPYSSDINVHYLEDLNGKHIQGNELVQELVQVLKPDKKIEKKLKYSKGKVLVKFKDHPESLNQSLSKSELKKYV